MGRLSLSVLLALAFTASTAPAAKLSFIPEFSRASLEHFSEVMDGHTRGKKNLWEGGFAGDVQRVEVLEWKKDEALKNTIKQIVHWVRAKQGEYSKPETVEVKSWTPSLANQRTALLKHAWRDVKEEKAAKVQDYVLELLDDVFNHSARVEMYTVWDGNGFGDCASLVLFDTVNDEALLTSSCYSE